MTLTLFRAETPNGDKYDLMNTVEEGFTWQTDIDYKAGELQFKLVDVEVYQPQMADRIAVAWDDVNIFYGVVFKTTFNQEGGVNVVAFDMLRYLKSQDTVLFPINTLTDRFNQVCETAGLEARVLDSSDHKLETELFDAKTYFEMIQKGCEAVRKATGSRYFIRDNFGVIELLNADRLVLEEVTFGDYSMANDWSVENSIEEAINSVKVVKMDGDKGIKSVVTREGDSIKSWGRLQKVESADNEDNEAKMGEKAENILRESNRVKKTLSLSHVIGDINVRAGSSFFIDFEQMTRAGIGRRRVLAQKVTHKFGKDWSMDLEIEVQDG